MEMDDSLLTSTLFALMRLVLGRSFPRRRCLDIDFEKLRLTGLSLYDFF